MLEWSPQMRSASQSGVAKLLLGAALLAACVSSTPSARRSASVVVSTNARSDGGPGVDSETGATTPDVRVGDARLDGSFLQPYESHWTVRVTLADGRPRDDASWVDRLEAIDAGGRRVLRRTQHESESLADDEVHPGLAKKLGKDRLELTMINDFDPRSLAPIATTVSTNAGRTMRLQFDGAHVTGARVGWQAAPVAIDDLLDAAPFDFHDGMYGYLAVALLSPEGFHARFAEYRAPRGPETRGALGWIDVRDDGPARVAAGSYGERDARVFVITDDDGTSFRFWTSREVPYVLRVVQNEPEAGQTWTFELQ